MKKRLLKAIPHIPLLELRPELREQDMVSEELDDPRTEQDAADNDEVDTESVDEEIPREIDTTFQNDLGKLTGAESGIKQRLIRFILRTKTIGKTNTARGTEDESMRYGDDESSETDNEEDVQDGIPLVQRH